MSSGVAHEKLRVGRALRALPSIDRAWASGQLTYSKVRALTRVATPDNEDDLLEIARSATAVQLERICRHYRAATCEKTPLDAKLERFVRVRQTDGGSTRITLQLPPDEGARFVAALDAARAQLDRSPVLGSVEKIERIDAESEDVADTECADADRASDAERAADVERADRADAAMALAESFFASGVRPRRSGAPHEVVLHVEADALIAPRVDARAELAQDAAYPSSSAEESTERLDAPTEAPRGKGALVSAEESNVAGFIENAGDQGVCAETARRLLCDASISVLVAGADGEALSAGRKRRTVPSALRRALDARARNRCQFPGCTHRYYLDAHHVQHWSAGGETSLGNLVLLCRRHHVLVHEHGWTIDFSAENGPRFCAPNGSPLAASPTLPATDLQALFDAVEDVDIDAVSLEPVGATWEIDYAQIIDALMDGARCRRLPAER